MNAERKESIITEPAPDVSPERIAANLVRVRTRMAEAADRAGRDSADVTLVAVSKYVGPDAVRALLAGGVTELGENRIQNALAKVEALGDEVRAAGARWRFIGHLQTNKLKYLLRGFDTLDAVDSIHLLEAFAEAGAKRGRPDLPCLAEVNVSGEAQKYGLAPGEVEDFLKRAAELRVNLQGLMCMAPYSDDPEGVSRPVFKRLREIFETANAKNWLGRPLTALSMGMSGDYTIAIEEGATLVRVGSALFESSATT